MHTVATAPALLHGVLHDPPPAHPPMAEMLLAARQLLGACDRALAHWPQPGTPAAREPVRPERVIAYRDQTALANTQAGPALTV